MEMSEFKNHLVHEKIVLTGLGNVYISWKSMAWLMKGRESLRPLAVIIPLHKKVLVSTNGSWHMSQLFDYQLKVPRESKIFVIIISICEKELLFFREKSLQ